MLFVGDRLHKSLDDVGEMDPDELLLWREHFRQADEARTNHEDAKADLRSLGICQASFASVGAVKEFKPSSFYPALFGEIERQKTERQTPEEMHNRLRAWCAAMGGTFKTKTRKETS